MVAAKSPRPQTLSTYQLSIQSLGFCASIAARTRLRGPIESCHERISDSELKSDEVGRQWMAELAGEMRVTKRLFIIGNGFDLHHGIASKYSDFQNYLERTDPKLHSLVAQYLAHDETFWWELEAGLANLDVDRIEDEAGIELVGYGSDEWSDDYNHSYQRVIEGVVVPLSDGLRKSFAAWVSEIEMPERTCVALIRSIDPAGLFLNFNYTSSLQYIYAVPDENVLHLHGKAGQPYENIVLGHGWERQKRRYSEDDESDFRVVQGQELIDDYFAGTFKPTNRIIDNNKAFFTRLRGIEEIVVLGHSLADVDMPYFAALVRHIDVSRVHWKISYYRDSSDARTRFGDLGTPSHLVEFLPLACL
jgi:hypothetical protein